MRVYVPATPASLAEARTGHWEPTSGFAVTPRLLEVSSHEDSDLLDEQARDAAALASVAELHAPLRVVIVADCSRSQVSVGPTGHPAHVTIAGRVPADAVVCAFIDEPSAGDDCRAAASGDEAALDRLYERDLLWYDVTEFDAID